MLRFFRINDPYRLVYIAVILIAIRIAQSVMLGDTTPFFELKWLLLGEWLNQGFKMYSQTYDFTAPFAIWVYQFIDFVFGRNAITHHIISALIIMIQAIIFNQMILENKVFDEKTYLPAFLYVVVITSVPDFMVLSPQLMSLTFILLSLSNLLRKIDNQTADEIFLKSGLNVGIASGFFLPSAVFLFVFATAFILFSSADLRRILLYLFSFLFAHILLIIYFFQRGSLQKFFQSFYGRGLYHVSESPFEQMDLLLIISGFALVLIVTLTKTISSAKLNNFQQKTLQVFILILIGGVLINVFSPEKVGLEFVFLVPVIGYFLTSWVLLLKKRIMQLVMPFILIGGLVTHGFFTTNYLADKITVSTPKPFPSETMSIGDLSIYQKNTINTPAFDAQLTQHSMGDLSDENIIRMYELFEEKQPIYIKDKLGVIQGLFSKLPVLSSKYKQTSKGEYLRISN